MAKKKPKINASARLRLRDVSFAFLDVSMIEMFDRVAKNVMNDKPARSGFPWTVEEEDAVLLLYERFSSITAISLVLRRTNYSILSKLSEQGLFKWNKLDKRHVKVDGTSPSVDW